MNDKNKLIKELFNNLDDEMRLQVYNYQEYNGSYPSETSLELLEKVSRLMKFNSKALNKLDQ